jgi:Protein-arginine deiminase (PAD)
MPDYELHADYDRNGRLQASTTEHDQRSVAPGAILLANIDVDGRALPASVKPGNPLTLDYQKTTKSGADNDLLPLQVRVINDSMPAGSTFVLDVRGELADQTRLYDRTGHAAPGTVNGATNRFVLTPTEKVWDLKLELRTLPGTPVGLGGAKGRQSGLIGAENALELTLVGLDPAGKESVFDSGVVTIAPFIIPANGDVATRLYIASIEGNEPSRADVAEVMRGIPGVQTVIVPRQPDSNDAWLQDQFQHGVIQSPSGFMHVILHMPRLRSDAVQVTPKTPENLSEFVVSHFPSSDVGLVQEFWDRSVPFTAADGSAHSVSFREGYELLNGVSKVSALHGFLQAMLILLKEEQLLADAPDWFDSRDQLKADAEVVLEKLKEQEKKTTNKERLVLLQNAQKTIKDVLDEISKEMPLKDDEVSLPLQSGSVVLKKKDVNELLERIESMHTSANYGGNIESAPPTKNAPFGTVIVGNKRVDGRDFMDPELLTFLRAQVQPVLEVDTTWLDVGHVDEILCVVPDESAAKFAILRASPDVAMGLVRTAHDRWYDNLPAPEPWLFNGPTRFTTSGKSPVTMMMRGKPWFHRQIEGAPGAIEPPRIFRGMAARNTEEATSKWPDLFYVPGPGKDRLYAAAISIEEFMEFELDRNRFSVNSYLATQIDPKLDKTLNGAFAEATIYQLPALFDRIDDVDHWKGDERGERTSAFLPDMINMQVVNGHLLIPKPFGPRLLPDFAISVVSEVLEAIGLGKLTSGLTKDWISKRKLDRTEIWVRADPPTYMSMGTGPGAGVRNIFSGYQTVGAIAAAFLDGFPPQGSPDKDINAAAAAIHKANRNAFRADGTLRDGFQKVVIPERPSVDIFEAYAQLVLESLGLTVHWVDSWYYHVRFGSIHCGTNVIRTPATKGVKRWWG